MENAVGQYAFYRSLLIRTDPDRKLFLAVPYTILLSTLDEPIARPVVEDLNIALAAFDPVREEIVKLTP